MLHTNVHFLPKNFEDAFDDGTISAAITELASKFGIRRALTSADVKRLRSEYMDMASALTEWWRRETGHDLDKVGLANLLASHVGGHPPLDIKRALELAVAHFEKDGEDDSGSDQHSWAKGRP